MAPKVTPWASGATPSQGLRRAYSGSLRSSAVLRGGVERVPGMIAQRLLAGAEWGFLGFLLFLSGLSTILHPETFGLRKALQGVTDLVPQTHGLFLLVGGAMIVTGVAAGLRWVQRLGLILLLPPLTFVCVLAPFVGGWLALRTELMSMSFLALVGLQVFRLFTLDRAEKDMAELVKSIRDKGDEDAGL